MPIEIKVPIIPIAIKMRDASILFNTSEEIVKKHIIKANKIFLSILNIQTNTKCAKKIAPRVSYQGAINSNLKNKNYFFNPVKITCPSVRSVLIL